MTVSDNNPLDVAYYPDEGTVRLRATREDCTSVNGWCARWSSCRAPQLGENIGAAARAMANFGLSDLRLVTPVCRWPNDKATAMAVGASNITDSARAYFATLAALSDLQLVYAADGARGAAWPKPILTPAEAATRLRGAAARGERTGLAVRQ